MIAKLEFDLPDDDELFRAAIDGSEYLEIIHEWSRVLRDLGKHVDLDEVYGSPAEYHAHLSERWLGLIEDIAW